MNILFFTSNHLNLYKPVVKELRSNGFIVTVLESPIYPNDPKINRKIENTQINSWNKKIENFWADNKEIWHIQYDLFICFNAPSINSSVLNSITDANPGIKKIVYLWDSLNYMDFNQIVNSFDLAFSFDYVDCKNNSNWILLPSFYMRDNERQSNTLNYDLFCIGFNHDDRYKFIKKILPQIKQYNLKYYIKILRRYPNLSVVSKIKFILRNILKMKNFQNMLFEIGIIDRGLGTDKLIPHKTFSELMSCSKCVLDDNRENQAGLSPRFIWAYFDGKLILTTNKWAHCYSFIDKRRVLIIEKNNPVINDSFWDLEEHTFGNPTSDSLHISNWVKILLGEVKCPKFYQ